MHHGTHWYTLVPQGQEISPKVNKLTSIKTQLPYEYYSLPYCRPDKIQKHAENLGEVLRGDRIENSVYQVGAGRVQCDWYTQTAMHLVFTSGVYISQYKFRVDEQCKVLCRLVLNRVQAKAFRSKIADEYRVNMCAWGCVMSAGCTRKT